MNKFAIGFAAVAALAVAGMDYVTQAQALGKGPGEFSAADYAQNVSARVGVAFESDADAPPVVAKSFLPDAPNGWQRRAWVPAPDAVRDPAADVLTEAALRARAQSEVWEYIGPNGSVRLSTAITEGEGRAYEKAVASDPASVNVQTRNGRALEIGEIKGVMFYAARHDEFDSRGTAPVFLRGYVGNDIRITAFAEGHHETVLRLLEAIDYDQLNPLQTKPARKVGSDAKDVTMERRAYILTKMMQVQKRAAMQAGAALKAAKPSAKPAKQVKKDKDEGGFFSGLGGSKAEKAKPEETGGKRLQLSSDSCQSNGVGKFCSAQ